MGGTAAVALAAGCQPQPGASGTAALSACERMMQLEAPDVRITSAKAEAGATPLCKVDGVIGREINFSVWMPDKWNGRFLMSGNGGLAGFIPQPPPDMLARGYAMAGTDTGHTGNPGDSNWSPGEMERQLNFAHLAIHRAAVTAKFAVKSRYSRAPDKNLFLGCSDGGRQALHEAQRYPDDFDGIIAGSPVINLPQHTLNQVTIARLMFPNGPETPVISDGDLTALHNAVLNTCDAVDGLKDGVINDPPSCAFDPKVLACKGANADGCLSPPELAAAQAIYGGTQLDGKPFAPGYEIGGEVTDFRGWGWHRGGDKAMAGMLPPGAPSPAYAIMSGPWIDGTQFNFFRKDASGHFSGDIAAIVRNPPLVTATMSPTNPDIDAFRKRGGKLLMFHGWSDTSLPPRMTLNYLAQVYARDDSARSDVRLFMEPGMLHCESMGGNLAGPPTPAPVDYVGAIDAWVSGATAPEEIEIRMPNGKGVRKLCAYPTKPTFKGGQGDGTTPDQFECR